MNCNPDPVKGVDGARNLRRVLALGDLSQETFDISLTSHDKIDLDEHEGQRLDGPLDLGGVDGVREAADVLRGGLCHPVVGDQHDVRARQQSLDLQLVHEVPDVLVGFRYCVLELGCICGGLIS